MKQADKELDLMELQLYENRKFDGVRGRKKK